MRQSGMKNGYLKDKKIFIMAILLIFGGMCGNKKEQTQETIQFKNSLQKLFLNNKSNLSVEVLHQGIRFHSNCDTSCWITIGSCLSITSEKDSVLFTLIPGCRVKESFPLIFISFHPTDDTEKNARYFGGSSLSSSRNYFSLRCADSTTADSIVYLLKKLTIASNEEYQQRSWIRKVVEFLW
jgi:hypothetical protein